MGKCHQMTIIQTGFSDSSFSFDQCLARYMFYVYVIFTDYICIVNLILHIEPDSSKDLRIN